MTAMNYIDAPERSLTQRMEALARANEVRLYRARAKRELKAGRVGLIDLLEDPMWESAKLLDALLAMPRFGRVKANRALRRCGISPSRTLGGLTRRQQDALVAELGDRAWPGS